MIADEETEQQTGAIVRTFNKTQLMLGRQREMMRLLQLLLLIVAGSGFAIAQTITLARQFGSAMRETATGIATGPNGVYVVGFTAGAIPGQTFLGLFDALIRKYDLAGNPVWTDQFGTVEADFALDVAADATGVYVVGVTRAALPGQILLGSKEVAGKAVSG